MTNQPNNSGDLDPSFGSGGQVFLQGPYSGKSLLLPDGKFLSIGLSAPDNIIITQRMTDGTLDPGFGNAGVVTTTLGIGQKCVFVSFVLQHDGKIVLAGNLESSLDSTVLLFARLTQNGLPDTSFGSNNGIMLINLNLSFADEVRDLTIQQDGKIVALARAIYDFNNIDTLLLRLEPDGTLDSTFGSGGFSYEFPSFSSAFRLTMQPDGKFLTSGSRQGKAMLSRYGDNGRPDASFGNAGHVYFDQAGLEDFAEVTRSALQNNGKIIVVGSTGRVGSQQAWIARLEASGDMDTSFNGGQPLVTKIGASGNADSAVAIQVDGKIVSLGGSFGSSAQSGTTLMRFLSNGIRDKDFGVDGMVQTPNLNPNSFDGLRHIQLQQDGRILVSGDAVGSSAGLRLARYLP